MPGFNQQGPDNQGPSTGNGRGICRGGDGLGRGARNSRATEPTGFLGRCNIRRRARNQRYDRSFQESGNAAFPWEQLTNLQARTHILEQELQTLQQKTDNLNSD